MDVKTVELHYKKPNDDVCILDITRQVEHSIVDSEMSSGIAIIHTVCSNASITTMEYEPGSISDLSNALKKFMPKKAEMNQHLPHGEDHQDIRPSMIGSSITIPFKDNRVMLGKWQEVVLIDFDGADNKKKVVVQIMGE